MAKVTLELNKGEAVITEGGSSFIGKLMASANRVRIHKPEARREVRIVKPTQARKAKK